MAAMTPERLRSHGSHGCHGIKCHGSYVKKPYTLLLEAMAAMALYGKELKFKTPNTVVVFSNEKPDVSELSKDRWKIFRIRDDDLIDVTDIYLEKM